MWNSKFFMIVLIMTTLAVAAAVGFQSLEMKGYDLFKTVFAGK